MRFISTPLQRDHQLCGCIRSVRQINNRPLFQGLRRTDGRNKYQTRKSVITRSTRAIWLLNSSHECYMSILHLYHESCDSTRFMIRATILLKLYLRQQRIISNCLLSLFSKIPEDSFREFRNYLGTIKYEKNSHTKIKFRNYLGVIKYENLY